MKTIVIDAGHGGYDLGATNGAGTRFEKNDNLKLALAVRDALAPYNQRVLLTRSTDVYLPLSDRTDFANRNNADLFISLHRNAAVNPQANGVENFVHPKASDLSKLYAKNVLDNVVNVGVQSNRGLKQEDFYVLRHTVAPAQLLELGFITNEEDNRLFDQNFYPYANAIAQGILKSLGITESTSTPTTTDTTIKNIQQTLNSRYGYNLAVDGIAGTMTRQALVKALQTELNRQYGAGLAVDGVFGSRTKSFVPNLRNGSRGNIVFLMQAALFIRGYLLGVDGIFGANTELMVRRFQQDNGLAPDGIAGPNTFERLFTW